MQKKNVLSCAVPVPVAASIMYCLSAVFQRFQKTYQALEQEGAAEKKQLIALHQQRVQADLNEKKRHAMEHYMSALQKGKPDVRRGE